jgi:hypothetical protein
MHIEVPSDASHLHQKSNASLPGRHLPLMRDLRRMLLARPVTGRPRILSFGCSVGYECLDLVSEIPEAEVFGCDINSAVREKALERCRGKATIVESSFDVLQALAPFDAVLALNVLCRHPETAGLDNVSREYPFHLFDAGLRFLDELLEPEGLLVIYNAQFFFEDSSVASRYCPMDDVQRRANGWIEKSLPSGERVTDVIFKIRGREYARLEVGAVARTLKMPDDLPLISYRHVWRAPSHAESRSTQRPVWRKVARSPV